MWKYLIIFRGPWTDEEDIILLKLIQFKGKKWSEISKALNNCRTENTVKNRYNSLLKKEKNMLSKTAISDLV